MDSASPDDWKWAVSGGAEEKLYDRDKDKTDFQLALSLFGKAAKLDASQRVLIVSGCFGGALDHLMSIFFTLGSCGGDFFRCMIDESEGVFFLSSGDEATLEFSRAPEAVSLMSVTDLCSGVSVSGVKWPLDGVTLERRFPWTVSNEVIPDSAGAPQVTAQCGDGTLALYWRH
jgi:thiamine pyrophosphokinase